MLVYHDLIRHQARINQKHFATVSQHCICPCKDNIFCRPAHGKALRNVIQTLAPFIGPRTAEAEIERPSVPTSIPKANPDAASNPSYNEGLLAFLADKKPLLQLASVASEACCHLTSIAHDTSLPPGTAEELAKLDLLLSGNYLSSHFGFLLPNWLRLFVYETKLKYISNLNFALDGIIRRSISLRRLFEVSLSAEKTLGLAEH